MEENKTAAEAVRKFITKFYKDKNIEDVSVGYGLYKLPYIIVWLNHDDPSIEVDTLDLRQKISQDVSDYLGYKLSPDPPSTFGVSPYRLKEYENADFYIDVR